MSPRLAHRYVAELQLAGGRRLRTAPLAIDWAPALECLHFQAVRRGTAGLTSAPLPACAIPQWDPHDGPPFVASVLLSPDETAATASLAEPIALSYFNDAVRRAVTALVEQGRLREGDSYTWRLCALDAPAPSAPTSSPLAFSIEPQADAEPVLPARRLSALRRASVRHGPPSAPQCDFPLFIRQGVLDDAIAVATAAGELEAGGVLLGHVARSTGGGDLVLEITAQVPAREAVAGDASLRFTPRTWQAVHAAIRLRAASERIAGWWHSHPRKVWPCHACTPQRRATCPLNHAFFSEDDMCFHRTAFSGPSHVALLFSFHDQPRPRHDVFGWRRGEIAARAYYVLEGAA